MLIKKLAINVKRETPGFTLVEILLVIVLFTISGLIISSLFIGHNRLFYFYTAEVNTGKTARLSQDRITSLIREASEVLSSHTILSTLYNSDAETIVLKLKTIDNTENFVVGAFDYAVFYKDSVSPNKLVEKVEAHPLSKRRSSTRILTDKLNTVNFLYNDSNFNQVDQVTVNLTTVEKFRSSASTTTLQTIVKLRNKS